jgi:hypothetical protein
MKKIFSAIHGEFYKEFDVWRKQMVQEKIPDEGVYILYANKPIHRLIGVDNKGILYIGKGDILSSSTRVGKFVNALNETENRHDGGLRFNLQAIKSVYPLEDATIEIQLTDDARTEERKQLNQYVEKYGELPPLNRSA